MLKNLLTLLVSCVSVILVAEAAFRIHREMNLQELGPVSDESQLWVHDPLLGWRKDANRSVQFNLANSQTSTSVSTNSHGLRDEEFSYEKPEGSKRILMLGDSTLVGMEVEKENVIDSRLEKLLAPHGRYQVINAGTRGWGTDQSLLFYREQGHKYQPDLVIYIFVENDPENNVTIHRPWRMFGKSYFVVENEQLVLKGTPVPETFTPNDVWILSDKRAERLANANRSSLRQQVKDFLYNFHFLRWVVRRVRHAMPEKEKKAVAPEPIDNKEVLSQPAWKITERLLKELREVVEADGGRLLVYEYSNGMGERPRSPTPLEEVTMRLGISYSNSFEEFFNGADGKPVFCYKDDPHWNEKGHALAAKSLYQYLQANPELLDGYSA